MTPIRSTIPKTGIEDRSMIPDTPSSAASGMGEYELASASVRPEPSSGVRVKPLLWNEYETEGEVDRWDAETATSTYYEINREFDGYYLSHDHLSQSVCPFDSPDEAKAAAQADYEARIRSALENQPVALADATKEDALSAKDRELAEARSENESHKTALLIALQEAEAWRAEAELEADKRAAAERNSADSIVAPAECGPNCDDPECPYSHQPLTLRQAYENAIHRMRAAERARDEALSALREMKEALRTCHRFLSNQTPNNDALLDMIDAVLARGGK